MRKDDLRVRVSLLKVLRPIVFVSNIFPCFSCFERWWCNKTGQACNLEIILVKTGVRSVWFDDFWSLCKVNYSISMSFIYFNHFKKKILLEYAFEFPLILWLFFCFQNSCWFCIHFWINLELRRVGKNIQNKDDRMNSL